MLVVVRVAVGSPNVEYHWEHLVRVPWRQMYELVDDGLLGSLHLYNLRYQEVSELRWLFKAADASNQFDNKPPSFTIYSKCDKIIPAFCYLLYSLRTTQSALAIAASKSISSSSSCAIILPRQESDDTSSMT